MATLLYEIGTEEMPAQYMPGILKNYKELAETNLKEARIPFEKVSVHETAGQASSSIGGIDDGVFNDPDISIKGVRTVPYFLVSIVSCGTVIIFFKAYTDAIVHAVLLSLSNVSKCFTA